MQKIVDSCLQQTIMPLIQFSIYLSILKNVNNLISLNFLHKWKRKSKQFKEKKSRWQKYAEPLSLDIYFLSDQDWPPDIL